MCTTEVGRQWINWYPKGLILPTLMRARSPFSALMIFLSMERLYANESTARSWGTGSRLMAMQDPKRGLPAPEPKREAPPPVGEPTPEGSS